MRTAENKRQSTELLLRILKLINVG